jgi:hypothetical protein
MNSRHLLYTPRGQCSEVGNLNIARIDKQVMPFNFYL